MNFRQTNYLIGFRVNRISSTFEFSARTIVREIDLLSVQWNEFAMARQGNNKDWRERIFGLEDEGCLVEKY